MAGLGTTGETATKSAFRCCFPLFSPISGWRFPGKIPATAGVSSGKSGWCCIRALRAPNLWSWASPEMLLRRGGSSLSPFSGLTATVHGPSFGVFAATGTGLFSHMIQQQSSPFSSPGKHTSDATSSGQRTLVGRFGGQHGKLFLEQLMNFWQQ